jgi:hypothetical protein
MFIPAHPTDSPGGAMGEGLAVDRAGTLYTAEARLSETPQARVRGVTKYIKIEN